jgi:hypothetical protein
MFKFPGLLDFDEEVDSDNFEGLIDSWDLFNYWFLYEITKTIYHNPELSQERHRAYKLSQTSSSPKPLMIFDEHHFGATRAYLPTLDSRATSSFPVYFVYSIKSIESRLATRG